MSYRPRAALAVALVLGLVVPSSAAASEPPTLDQAWLSGSFGSVLGTAPDQPARAAPDDRPLQTWMRQETLELVLEPALGEADAVTLTATDEAGHSVELHLADGRWVTGPSEHGRQTVVATVARPGAEPTEHAWLLDVADRPGSWETLLQRPPLEALLVAEAGGVLGARGHGCLSGFCQEAGHRPPAETLEPLAVTVGQPLRLELADGSAVVGWQGRAEPAPATGSEARRAEVAFDEPVAGPPLTGLEPDAPGEWLLEVRADYDRERGWQWYLFRLIAE